MYTGKGDYDKVRIYKAWNGVDDHIYVLDNLFDGNVTH